MLNIIFVKGKKILFLSILAAVLINNDASASKRERDDNEGSEQLGSSKLIKTIEDKATDQEKLVYAQSLLATKTIDVRQKALNLLDELIEKGHEEAVQNKFTLAVELATFENNEDNAVAFRLLNELAAINHMEATYHLGNYYNLGGVVPFDINKALVFYEKAANKIPGASFEIGNIYLKSAQNHLLGTKNDIEVIKIIKAKYDKAYASFEKAAQGGHAEAFIKLGNMHREGMYQNEGVSRIRNTQLAAQFYLKAYDFNKLVVYEWLANNNNKSFMEDELPKMTEESRNKYATIIKEWYLKKANDREDFPPRFNFSNSSKK